MNGFDYSKLRGRIIEKYKTIGAFALEMGVTPTHMSNKLQNRSPFSQVQIEQVCTLLNIKPKEIPDYFFTQNVQ